MQVYKIDENGYYVKPVNLDKGQQVPLFGVEEKPPQGLYRAKWTGTEWIEGMSQEEIDAINNQPKELTENEMIMLAITDLAEIVLGGIE